MYKNRHHCYPSFRRDGSGRKTKNSVKDNTNYGFKTQLL